MNEIVFAIPGDLDLPTGGYRYDRRILSEWRAAGVQARHLALPGSFPNPSEADFAETGRQLLGLPWETVLLIDGLAYGAFTESMAAGLAGRVVALVHHPLGYETGLTPERAAAMIAREAAALRHAAAIVATSPSTARLLAAEFGVAATAITVAEPGTDPAPRAHGPPAGAPVSLLAVGSVVARKGYETLVTALQAARDLDWRLTIAGATDRAPATHAALLSQIAAAGLGGRIVLAGAISDADLERAYAATDLFVMPSLFEGYGMALTEALARGLPILCTTGGAAAETISDACAEKVPPGDAAALAAALRRLINDPAARRRKGEAAWAAAAALPRWRDTARIVAETCAKVTA